MKKFVLFFSVLALSYVPLSAMDYNILSYGAIPDGKTLNTESIQTAIDTAFTNGGGRVVIPSGSFLTGSIVLKTGVDLHLGRKAILMGSLNRNDYLKLGRWPALILAENSNHLSISGRGVIDGRGAKLALRIDSLFYIGELDSSKYSFPEMRPREYMRPQILEFRNCKYISITDVTIKNAASWVQTYEFCDHLIIDHITVDSDCYWNNDGMDILDCKNVRIINCNINSADDGISLKSEDFSKVHFSDSIYIGNCKIRSSASAIKFGTSSVSRMQNVVIEDIKVYDTYRSAIAIESVQGGVIENIVVKDIKAKNTGNAIFLRIGRVRNAKVPGELRNVSITNIKVKVPFSGSDDKYEIRGPELPFFHNVFPSSITGLPDHLIENVTISDVTIVYPGRGNRAFANLPLSRLDDVPELETSYPEFSMFGELPAWGFYVRHVDGLTMSNINIKIKEKDYRPAIVFDDVKNATVKSVNVKGDKKANPIFLHNVKSVEIVE